MKKSNLGLGFFLCLLSILVTQQANGLRPIRDTSRSSWGEQLDGEVKKHEVQKLVGVYNGDNFEDTVGCTCTRKSKCMTSKCHCLSAKVRCGDSCGCKAPHCANRKLSETLKEHDEVVVNVQVGAVVQTLRVSLGAARE
ncbi:hypothetical protein DY000_02020067 [Brassica cretica]|uniref:Tesmin/TSO1-like CXC domain-containing protein n=1 Tax=Brassica cretica TaxID=69181 RepID=A0ABQ7EFW4_BRACR|nr:hypothetical protein DY000_02020067 [Brassica cretica]